MRVGILRLQRVNVEIVRSARQRNDDDHIGSRSPLRLPPFSAPAAAQIYLDSSHAHGRSKPLGKGPSTTHR